MAQPGRPGAVPHDRCRIRVLQHRLEAEASALLGVTFTARPDTANGKEPVREITGIPPSMIAFHSRRRAAIEARYTQLLKDFRREHGHDPDLTTCHSLARQANLTRQRKEPPTTLAAKRAAWREEITARFGPGAVSQIINAVPGQPPARTPDTKINPDEYAERIVASTSARRSTWTIWNVRAETERVLRDACPLLSPDEQASLPKSSRPWSSPPSTPSAARDCRRTDRPPNAMAASSAADIPLLAAA